MAEEPCRCAAMAGEASSANATATTAGNTPRPVDEKRSRAGIGFDGLRMSPADVNPGRPSVVAALRKEKLQPHSDWIATSSGEMRSQPEHAHYRWAAQDESAKKPRGYLLGQPAGGTAFNEEYWPKQCCIFFAAP